MRNTIQYLGALGYLNWVPDSIYLRAVFRARIGKKLNLKNPKTFSEKMQWLKLNDRRPEYTMMADKYAVRKFIAQTIGAEYLIPLVGGPWTSFDEIDFAVLPNRFVLKCTHDSGGLVICRDKTKFDLVAAKEKIETCLKYNYFWSGREWPYKNIQPRIIAETYLDENWNLMSKHTETTRSLTDYKIMCFNGKARCLYTCTDRYDSTGMKLTFFDIDWNRSPFSLKDPVDSRTLLKPHHLDRMVMLAEKLASDLPFVRVDFYEVNDQVYFGEITFFPFTGMEIFVPDSYDKELGSWIQLPLAQV